MKHPVIIRSSVARAEDDEFGLGFHDIVSTPTPKKKARRITPDAEEKKDDSSAAAAEEKCKAHQPVLSFCLHPGLVRTDVVRDMPWFLRYPNRMFSIFMAVLQKTPQAGAYTSVFCAIMDTRELAKSDCCCYFVDSKPQSLFSVNEEDATRLWDLSSKLVKKQTKSVN